MKSILKLQKDFEQKDFNPFPNLNPFSTKGIEIFSNPLRKGFKSSKSLKDLTQTLFIRILKMRY